MTGTRPTPDAVGGIGLLERAISYTLGSLMDVTAQRLPDPTPCAGWALRELLAHLDDSMLVLCRAAEVGQVAVESRVESPARSATRPPGCDPVGTVRDRARRLLEGWTHAPDRPPVAVGGRPLSTAVLTGTGALEVAVHGWDIARTCRSMRPIPPALAEELLDLAPLLVTDGDRPGHFAAPVTAPSGSAPGDRLVAFLGRPPAWAPDRAPPDETRARAA